MNILNLVEIEAVTFLLILARMSAFMVTWPVLGSVNVPAQTKILFSLLLTLTLFPMLKGTFMLTVNNWQMLIFFVVKEAFIGLALAFIATMFFHAVAVGSDLVALGMGISSAKIFNPSFEISMTPIDHFYYIFAALLFLLLNLHHTFLTGLVKSYDIIPASKWGLELGNFPQIALFGKEVLIIGLQLAAPILVSILLINITLAIVGRAVPQINVLITSLPINILVGLLILIASVPLLLSYFTETMQAFTQHFFKFLTMI